METRTRFRAECSTRQEHCLSGCAPGSGSQTKYPALLLSRYPTRAELWRPSGQHVCNIECLGIRLAARNLLQGMLPARGTRGMGAKLLKQLNPARHALRANQTAVIQAVAGRGSTAPGRARKTPAAVWEQHRVCAPPAPSRCQGAPPSHHGLTYDALGRCASSGAAGGALCPPEALTCFGPLPSTPIRQPNKQHPS